MNLEQLETIKKEKMQIVELSPRKNIQQLPHPHWLRNFWKLKFSMTITYLIIMSTEIAWIGGDKSYLYTHGIVWPLNG